MAKKLVSIDDAKTGEAALPEAVNAVLRNTYGRKDELPDLVGDALADEPIPEELESTEYLKGTLSPSGVVFEDAIGMDGSVPQWILDRWARRMGVLTTAYDIVIVAGQSNATQVETPPVTVEDSDPRIFRWNSTTSKIEALPASSVYLGSYFARAYARSNFGQGRRILIVDCAVGSTGFTSTSLASPPAGYHTVAGGTWDRTLTSDPINLYSRMISRVQAARTAAQAESGSAPRIAAMLWSQGEEDTTTDAANAGANYAPKLDDLISQARTDLGEAQMPVLVYSMVPDWVFEYAEVSGRSRVQDALTDTPARVQRTAYVPIERGHGRRNDIIHFSPEGQRRRGDKGPDALRRARFNVTGARVLPPTNLRLKRTVGTVLATWDPAPTRATAYTCDYSTDNGATWTAVTLGSALALQASISVEDGTAVLVRVGAASEDGTSPYVQEAA